MVQYNEALHIILQQVKQPETEKIRLSHSQNRILAQDVIYTTNMPPFDKSAMDGYACRRKDINNELVIIETIFAGKNPEKQIGENQCAKIMTGAVVPKGADCVFMLEDSELIGDEKVKCTNANTKSNICYRGEDIEQGTVVLEQHTRLLSKCMPLLAGAGMTWPKVYKLPIVTVFATGTELVEPDEDPLVYQIRNSNSTQLMSQIAETGILAHYGGIIKDEENVTSQTIQKAFETSEVVILTGGVSVGDYDLVPEILEKSGFEILISATAIQPGKPMLFATKENKYCFGLSGNPVSSFIQFELYVKPFLFALMGYNYKPNTYKLPLRGKYVRKKVQRLQFAPATIIDNEVVPLEFHGSAHINALSKADCLLEVPVGILEITEGELVNVRPI